MTENHSKTRSIIEEISGIPEEKPLPCRNADFPLVIFVIAAIVIIAGWLFFASNAH